MRVLAIGSMYPPHHLGGYELVWQGATEHLVAAGHHVRVLCSDLRLPGRGGDAPGPPVHRELRWYWQDHAFPRRGPLGRLRIERHNAEVLDRHLADHAPDVVAWWAMGGMSLSLLRRVRRAGVPSAAFVHDDWLLYGPVVDGWSRLLRRRPDPGDADAWAFVSATTRERAEAALGPFPGAQVVPSGIAAEAFAARPERPWGWRLLVAGRIDARKGIDTAIDALAELPEQATLTVVGEGDAAELAALRARASRVGRRVVFAGARDRRGLAEAYADADAVLFPVRWEEPWGLVPLEAMASGRPVVASGRGGSGEYLRDGHNALLAPADDPPALAAAVRRLAGDPELRRRLRAGGLATAAQHTDARFHAAVEALLRRVSGDGRGTRRGGP